MRKLLSLLLALMMVVSTTVIAVNAVDTDAADTAVVQTATVTLTNVKGESVTQTYAVGETFTATTYLNVSGATDDGKISSINLTQEYDQDMLQIADPWNDDNPDSFSYGTIKDLQGMFPVIGSSAMSNAAKPGKFFFNASTPQYGFTFNTDDTVLFVIHYTVLEPGEVSIVNQIKTLAKNDFYVSRIIDKGVIKDSGFTNNVALSEPAEQPAGSTVSGTVVSYITDSDVTLELVQNDAVVASTTVIGTVDAESPKNSQPVPFSIEGVEDGAYTLRVSKANHVTRSYAITVSGDTAVDEVVKICPLGDANNDGVVDAKDVTRTYRHALTAIELTGYQYDCANVATKNPAVNASDVTKIYRHVLESESLWT